MKSFLTYALIVFVFVLAAKALAYYHPFMP